MDTHELITKIEQNMPPPYPEYKALVTPSEAPLEFHSFIFLTMISAIIGDKVYFTEGTDKIYPNLWTLLVGESSVSRKSSSIRPALLILDRMKSVYLFASRGSTEGLFEEVIKVNGVGLLSHSELGSLLGTLKKDYMQGLTEIMCELYDPAVPTSIKKKLVNRDATSVDHLAISWIACTTQASLSHHLTSSDDRIASGFLPRFNIVFGTTITDLIPFRPAKDQAKQDALLKSLADLVSRFGKSSVEYIFSQEAVEMFSKWYNTKRQEMSNGGINDVVSYFWIRTLEVVKKYALVFVVLKGKSNIVDRESMEQAILIGEYFLATSQRLIQKEISSSYDERQMQKVIKALEKHNGEASHREILRHTGLISAKLEPILRTLLDRGTITERTESGKGRIFILME